MRRHDAACLGLLLVSGATAGCGENAPNNGPDHPSATIVRSVAVAGAPFGVAISADDRAYVTLLVANAVVSDETLPVDAFGAPIAVGLAPPAVTFNPAGTRAYVTNQDGQTLHVIDVASATVIDTIVLGNAGFSVITSRDGTEVFASVATGQVYVISASTNAIVDSIVLPWGVHAFARHPTDDRIYMSTRLAVFEINARTHQVLRSFRTGDLSQRLAVSPDGRELLVANEVLGLDIWRIWDAARDTTIQLEAFGLGLSPDGEKIYLVGSLSGEITIVDRRTRLVDTVLTVGGKPRNVAFSQDGRVAVITNEADFVTVVE